MSVQIQFVSLVVPRARIAAVPGLAQRMAAAFPNAWQDEHLWVTASMGPVGDIAAWLEREGLVLREHRPDGSRVWRDVCVVDYYNGPTLPCAWLQHDPQRKIAWLAGTAPGPLAGPKRAHEAAPIKLSPEKMHELLVRNGHRPPAAAPAAPAPRPARQGNLDPDSESRWRIARILCLLAVLVLSPLMPFAEIFGPTVALIGIEALFRGGVLLALAAQVYLFVRPLQARSGVFVFREDMNVKGEGAVGEAPVLIMAMVMVGILRIVGLEPFFRSFSDGMAPLAHALLWLVPVLMIVTRKVVVFDTNQRRIYRLGLLPRVFGFDAVQGFGTVFVRRGGTFVGLFFGPGDAWKLQMVRSANEAKAQAMALTLQTGIGAPRLRPARPVTTAPLAA